MASCPKAFILGAGLGTRLRPLTQFLPKPLVPVGNKPLITYALDHLAADLGVKSFLVNTHHCPEAYETTFPANSYQGHSLEFRHEPVLLDTGGGIDNIRDWLPRDESFAVYNGDILTDLPLQPAWETHCASGDAVTLLLRSRGDELRVGFDESTGKVVDLRGALQPDFPHRFQFTGIYFVAPEFLDYVKPGKIESVVVAFLDAIRDGSKVGGVVVDEGHWSDLGERDSYLDALDTLQGDFPRYGACNKAERIASSAKIAHDATIDAVSTVGENAIIESGVQLESCSIWPGAVVEEGSVLQRVIVRDGMTARGSLENSDI